MLLNVKESCVSKAISRKLTPEIWSPPTEAKGALKYFDNLRNEHGCAQLISLEELNDPCNGYLVNDCCVFGVEVFVIQPSSGNEETLTMVKEPNGRTYTWSIKNFSKLDDNLQYSDEFTVGGNKWNLKLFPKGIKSDMGKSLSLYIWLSDMKSVAPERKVYAEYKLRIVDHSRLKKVEKQDAKGAVKRFDKLTTVWGFDQLLSLEKFNDSSNGYLVNDCCAFGAEVFIVQPNSDKEEILSMVKKPPGGIFTWPVQNFRMLNESLQSSIEFTVGDRKWMLWLYPVGHGPAKRKALSLYLKLADWENFSPRRSVYAEFTLRILDHRGIKNVEKTGEPVVKFSIRVGFIGLPWSLS
ncbi:hypothetical protein LWI29_017297 [Acer saccharum]|uniref:MATH domain-containing protein n=1 Tax=Acer saccharum TaxID=4024 RepID=A0AA39RX72_ACESA|nr:hypothetical protein LWI29_017297 [Acer saccharum]